MTREQLARSAKDLLANGATEEVFQKIEDNLILDFKMCRPTDVEVMHSAKLQLHALFTLKRAIFQMASALDDEETTDV